MGSTISKAYELDYGWLIDSRPILFIFAKDITPFLSQFVRVTWRARVPESRRRSGSDIPSVFRPGCLQHATTDCPSLLPFPSPYSLRGMPSCLLRFALPFILLIAHRVTAIIPYRPDLAEYNLNANQDAKSVLDYHATRPDGNYTTSPTNWRTLPFYTLLLDKFADGDPTNNDYFNTLFENDWRETTFRYGGDLKGLSARLDYLQGMGIGAIFIAGTAFLNMPWQADSAYKCPYMPLAHHHHQVILLSTLVYSIRTGERLTIGKVSSTKFMPGVCTSCWILR